MACSVREWSVAAQGSDGRSYVVAQADEIPPGARKIVTVAGRSIGVFNVDGRYYAIRNRCPHQGAELCRGRTVGEVTSNKPGEYTFRSPGAVIRCPWHGWEFELSNGRSWFDPATVRVKSYKVDVVPADAIGDLPDTASGRDVRVPGSLRAEAYDVSIEADHVVVKI